jgi:thiosulfate/3-mercaptopyruvate sulfurtransferase
MDARAGHIPGAINLAYASNLDGDGRFLPPEELLARFAAAGITSADTVVNYCGSGVSACHNLLAMEHAGLPMASLYPGSWSAWAGDPARPAATGG